MIDLDNAKRAIGRICTELPLPVKASADNEVAKTMHSYFNKYRKILGDERMDAFLQEAIQLQCDLLKESFLSFTKGLLTASLKSINELLSMKIQSESIVDYLTVAIDPNGAHEGRYGAISNQLKALYRARLGDNFNYKPLDLFHIPFDARGVVKSQRFSISGLPCLYLGSSSLLCWEELDRPAYSDMHLCRYQLIDKVSVLNLAYDSHQVSDMLAGGSTSDDVKGDWATRFLLIFPLLAACSIVVNGDDDEEERTFKSEYIIPQMLMLAVREGEFAPVDGIMYLSCKRSAHAPANIWVNYAFLPQGNDFRPKHSERLKKIFCVTTPFNLQQAMSLTANERRTIIGNWMNEMKDVPGSPMLSPLDSGMSADDDFYDVVPVMGRVQYCDTTFGEVDKFLRLVAAGPIDHLQARYDPNGG